MGADDVWGRSRTLSSSLPKVNLPHVPREHVPVRPPVNVESHSSCPHGVALGHLRGGSSGAPVDRNPRRTRRPPAAPATHARPVRERAQLRRGLRGHGLDVPHGRSPARPRAQAAHRRSLLSGPHSRVRGDSLGAVRAVVRTASLVALAGAVVVCLAILAIPWYRHPAYADALTAWTWVPEAGLDLGLAGGVAVIGLVGLVVGVRLPRPLAALGAVAAAVLTGLIFYRLVQAPDFALDSSDGRAPAIEAGLTVALAASLCALAGSVTTAFAVIWLGKTCPDCAERVAVNAEDCPHCGHRFQLARGWRRCPSAPARSGPRRGFVITVTRGSSTSPPRRPLLRTRRSGDRAEPRPPGRHLGSRRGVDLRQAVERFSSSLRAFLDDAGDEPLTWELKGDEKAGRWVRREQVLEAVCGFANSDRGGVLLIGGHKRRGAPGWDLPGLSPPKGEPGPLLEQWVRQRVHPTAANARRSRSGSTESVWLPPSPSGLHPTHRA